MTTPVVFQYQQALDEFRREGREPPLLKRMSELISLLDLSTTLGSTLSGAEILDAALLIVMGELQVSRGALYVAGEEGRYRRRAARGLPPGRRRRSSGPTCPSGRSLPGRPTRLSRRRASPSSARCGRRAGRSRSSASGRGPRGGPSARRRRAFSRASPPARRPPSRTGSIYEELRRVNRSLSVKVYQLHSLFDIGRELTASLDEEAIERLVATTVMGHFLASRCALYRLGPDGLDLAHARGREAGRGAPAGAGRPRGAAARPAGPAVRGRAARGGAQGGPLGRALRARGAARGRGAAERPPRGGGAAGRARLRRGGPRLRGRPRAPGPGRARGRACAPHAHREGAAGPRPADRPRDPAEPLPEDLAAGRGLRGGGGEPLLLPGRGRLLRLHPARGRAAWGS